MVVTKIRRLDKRAQEPKTETERESEREREKSKSEVTDGTDNGPV